MRAIKPGMLGLLALAVISTRIAVAAPVGLCQFDVKTKVFAGTPAEQATCLLRNVNEKGSGSVPQSIPAVLLDHVATDKDLPAPARLNAYLAEKGISTGDLGGVIVRGDLPEKNYFVIHDTSVDLGVGTTFPSDINKASWQHNSLSGHTDLSDKVHLIVNRVGASRAFRDLKAVRPASATKLEGYVAPAVKPIFLHVENIQPRFRSPGSKKYAWIAPFPGLSSPQMDRLALIYVASSIRAGKWLIPAFHLNVDFQATSLSAHDDPQHFDLNAWGAAVASLVSTLSPTGSTNVVEQVPAAASTADWIGSEYAIRWHVDEGGPKTIDAVLLALTSSTPPNKIKSGSYKVQYYLMNPAPAVAPGLKPILRTRAQAESDDERYQLTYKIRGDSAFAQVPGLCPIKDPDPDGSKFEVDGSVISLTGMKLAYSFSCTKSDKTIPVEPGPDLNAAALPCNAEMKRASYKTAGVRTKIELWEMPGEKLMLEVSREGTTSDGSRDAFLKEIAKPLIDVGVKPVSEGKTSAASKCPP